MKKSRKIILFALILFTGFQMSFAQIQFSPKIGFNASALDNEQADRKTEARVGWNLGADLRIGQETIFLKTGAHYQSFTARLIKEDSGAELKDETQIQYLKIPVNVGWRLTGDGGFLNLHAHGGLVPNVLLGVKEKAAFNFDKDTLKSFNLGANIGLGVDISIFTINAQYEWGITDFFEGNDGKNDVFTLSVGLVL